MAGSSRVAIDRQDSSTSISNSLANTPSSRRQSIAKLKSSPLKRADSSSTNELQEVTMGGNSAANASNAKYKMSAITSMLHDSPSSNSVFSMTSGENFAAVGNTHTTAQVDSSPHSRNNGLGIPSFAVDTNDYDLINEVHKHLVSENSLQLPGGDITRDIYKITNNTNTSNTNHELESNGSVSSRNSTATNSPGRLRRSSSFSFSERRGSSASGINVPGGFRREYLVKKKKDELISGNLNVDPGEIVDLPPFLTRNFMEFLSIYGHFAGESLEDDDFKTCTLANIKTEDLENMPLLAASNGQYPSYSSAVSAGNSPTATATKINERTATATKAYFLLLKSFVGTGILFLPKAFYNGGLLFSIIVLFFFAIYSFWCYYILIETKTAMKVSSFGEMGFKLYGSILKNLIIFSIILSQIGFVGTYLVFTSTNLQAFFHNVFNVAVEIKELIIMQCLIFIPLALIRNITKLSLTSLVANFFIFAGLLVIIYYSFADLMTNGVAQDLHKFNKDNWSLFIGVAIFAFEGIGLIIPIEESMIQPEKFPKVLFLVILTVSALMLIVGTLCYSVYGSNVNTVIILNLPQDSVFVNSIQLFYSCAILLSAPLQLFPVIKIIENKVFAGKKTRCANGQINLQIKWAKNCLRAFLVVCCAVIAYFGSANLDKFVSFIGCFACIPLVYMYPPMLHYKAVSKTPGARFLDVFLVVFGGVAMVYVLQQLL